MMQSARHLAGAMRAGEWWDHKLLPVLAVFYGTLSLSHRAVSSAVPAALALMASIAAAAAFVSVLNDLADRADDAAAGKPNRMAGRSRAEAVLFSGIPALVGLAFMIAWRADLPLLFSYAGSWLAFSSYSLPPLRLKTRGLAGVAADAAGAHLFPALVAMLLAARATGATPDRWWTASVALWSFAYGVRGILWHQLLDSDNDRRAGVATFARRVSPARAARFATYGVFPVEVGALAAMLVRLDSPWPALFLALYGLLVGLRAHLFGARIAIVASRGRWAMALQDYYELFLPVSILWASALAHPIDWLVLLAQFAFFPRRWLRLPAKLSMQARAWRPFPRRAG